MGDLVDLAVLQVVDVLGVATESAGARVGVALVVDECLGESFDVSRIGDDLERAEDVGGHW